MVRLSPSPASRTEVWGPRDGGGVQLRRQSLRSRSRPLQRVTSGMEAGTIGGDRHCPTVLKFSQPGLGEGLLCRTGPGVQTRVGGSGLRRELLEEPEVHAQVDAEGQQEKDPWHPRAP